MDQIHVIRHKVLVEGVSVRRVAREMGVARNTVKRYLAGADPGIRKAPVRSRPTLDKARVRLDAILESSSEWTRGKQRLTAARVFEMLRAEGIEVGETLVKSYVREWRRKKREVFVPLVYPPGELAQVDFFEVWVEIGGEQRKAYMFLMRLMYSGRDFAWLYPRQDQVSFLDGHVRAFEHFGCVPHRIAYDNLAAAVRRKFAGKERMLAQRFLALCTHYVFEASFCRPRTGHDKGGVESRGKAIRLQHLVPIPKGADLCAISTELLSKLDAQAQTKRKRDGTLVADRFETERKRMLPLPRHRFRSAKVLFVPVSRRSLAQIAGAAYSVWSRWNGLEVTAYVGVEQIEIVGPDDRVVHERQPFGGRSVRYRHFLDQLARKPQALRQVAGELLEELGEPFGQTWRRLVDAHGPLEAARQFAPVCAAIVEHGEPQVARRLERALRDDQPLALVLSPQRTNDVDLQVLPARLAQVTVESASAADFDRLIGAEA